LLKARQVLGRHSQLGGWPASSDAIAVLDLAAVMSSFSGETGGNVRQVLDYAKGSICICFLMNLTGAKRRDDATEIGELKRL